MPLTNFSSANQSMKINNRNCGNDASPVPLPIQTFLWRQSNPFLGSKVKKLHEASAVTFERVVVQNILHGLSPSLSDAINSIPRWQFVKTAFPHIVQCCGSILGERVIDEIGNGNLSSSLVKLLYILHWLLMDSSNECNEDPDSNNKDNDDCIEFKNYVFSISNIQHFVYMIIPMLQQIKENELVSHYRLESGIKIWKALWAHRIPDVICFYAPVKQKYSPLPLIKLLTKKTSTESISNCGMGVYLGDEINKNDIINATTSRRFSHTTSTIINIPPPKPPRTNETLMEDLLSGPSIKTNENKNNGKIQNSRQSIDYSKKQTVITFQNTSSQQLNFSRQNTLDSPDSYIEYRSSLPEFLDVSAANYLDVAVIRCLLIQYWTEDGVLWSLHYLYNRIHDIQYEKIHYNTYIRSRSNSVPGKRKDTKTSLNGFTNINTMCDPFISTNTPQLTFVDLHKSSEILDRRLSTKISMKRKVSVENKNNDDKDKDKDNSQVIGMNEGISISTLELPSKSFIESRKMSLSTIEYSKTRRLSKSSVTLSQLSSQIFDNTLKNYSEEKSPEINNAIKPFLPSISGKYFSEAVGSSSFITHDGKLSFTVILKTILSIIDRYQNIKICEIVLSISDVILSLTTIIHSNECNISVTYPLIIQILSKIYIFMGCSVGCNEGMRTAHAAFLKVKAKNLIGQMIRYDEKYFKKIVGEEFENKSYHQVLDFIHSITAFCGEKNSLNVGKRRSTGVNSRLSFNSSSSYKNKIINQKKNDEKKGNSYKNAFNESMNGIEGIIIDIFFNSLVSKLNEKARELLLPENMSVYHDVRMFVAYVNEYHGNPLRKTALSALIDKLKIIKRKYEDDIKKTSIIDDKKNFIENDIRKKSNTASITTIGSGIKGYGKTEKFGIDNNFSTLNYNHINNHSIRSASHLKQHSYQPKHSTSLDQFNDTDSNGGIGIDIESNSNILQKQNHIDSENQPSNESLGIEDGGVSTIPHPSPILHGTYANTKRKQQNNLCGGSSSSNENTLGKVSGSKFQFAFSLLKGTSANNSNTNLRQDLSEEDIISLASSKNGIEMMGNFSTENIINLDDENFSYSSPAIGSLTSKIDGYNNNLTLQKETINAIICDKKMVNLKNLREGIRRFNFLLEMSNPGDVLDAPLIGALIDLKSPIISRACILLECSFYINRCNKGDWAEWIKSNISINNSNFFGRSGCTTNSSKANQSYGFQSSGWYNAIGINTYNYGGSQIGGTHKSGTSLGSNLGVIGRNKKLQSMQRLAGKNFYRWGLCLAGKLKVILDKEDENEKNLDDLSLNDKRSNKLHEELECFLDDATVNNSSGEGAPKALQLLGCFLLLQITTYLRESFQILPKVNKNINARNSGNQFTLQNCGQMGPINVNDSKYNSQRRWSILSNTFIQHGGSVHSINEPSIPQVGIISNVPVERRVSYSTIDDDSSTRGSHDTIDELSISNNLTENCRKSGSSKSTRISQGRTRLFKKTSPIRKSSTTDTSGIKTTHKRDFSFKFRRSSKQQVESQLSVSPTTGHENLSEERENIEDIDNSTESGNQIYHSPLITQNEGNEKSPERRCTASIRKNSLLNQVHQNLNSVPSAPVTTSTIAEEDDELSKKIPWIPIILRVLNSFDFSCNHELICKNNCFLRCYKQCHKLLEAFKIIHGKDDDILLNNETLDLESMTIFMPLFDKREKILESFENYKRGNYTLNKGIINHPSISSTRRESAIIRGLPNNPSNCNNIFDDDKKIPISLKGIMDKLGETEDTIINSGQVKQGSDKGIDNKELLEIEKVEENELNKLNDILSPISVFINTQLKNVIHAPISFFLKSAVIMKNEDFNSCVKTCWNLLTFNDTNISSSAAALFILCAIKIPNEVTKIITEDLNSSNPDTRISGIQKFYVLWRNRFHVWQKMEDGAQSIFKIPPPSIDFTLPSPMIGQSHAPVIDPPWMPYVKTRVEELSIKEEQHSTSQTIMTMTRTRRKQKQEMVKKAIREAEEKQSELRQKYMIRSTALIQQSAYEPTLFQHSIQTLPPSSQGSNIPISNSNVEFDIQEIDPQVNINVLPQATHSSQKHMPMAVITQPLLPSSILAAVPHIVELYSDVEVSRNGLSVCCLAKQVTWSCIIEEPSLFFRHFLEKLTNKDKQEYMISLLRKLLLAFKYIPSQTAYCLLNYFFGFVMFYVRSPSDGSDKILSLALSTIWLITPYVHGLYFKDLKQTLKKEQCDQALMITANVPSAKKIIVHGPDQSSGGIPSQFPIHEDTQFHQILIDSIEFFNIPQEEANQYYLVDAKTGMVHVLTNYVRDFYFFHRSFYPQLYLVKLNCHEAMIKQKLNTFYQKQIESGKVLLTHNALKHSPENVIPQRIFFLHDEFTHLLSFPRKAIESSFSMYFGDYGDELKAVDSMHKLTWVNLITSIFEKMENAFMFGDLHLFINVINGVMIVHCEDILILRRCLATYLTVAIHFNQHFASQGFFLIIPTILRCYSQRQTNRMFCESIEFLCKQFYILHRKPFLLQMFGAIANLIDMNNNMLDINPVKIKGKYFFNLIKSMESLAIINDTLDILSLVPYPKPLKPLDLCYKEDPNAFNLLTDAMASCVTVCCYAPESKRSYQMILVMEAFMQHYFENLEEETSKSNNNISSVKMEINFFNTICVEMKALINGCDILARGPNRTFDSVLISSGVGDMKSRNFVMAESPMFFDPPTMGEEETIVYGNNSNGGKINNKEKCRHQISSSNWDSANNENSSEIQRELYRRPRDALLTLSALYIEKGSTRLKELSKLSNLTTEHLKLPELFDHKCHIKLAEIALSLLKLASSDLITMSSVGLQKYFTIILPITDWSIEANRSILTILLRRLDKTISKIGKKPSLRRRANWNALAGWLSGLHQTLALFPYIAHLHPVKTISQMCLRIIVGDNCQDDSGITQTITTNPNQGTTYTNTTNFNNSQVNVNFANTLGFNTIISPFVPNIIFSNTVIKLVLFLMQALGQLIFSIETVCSPESVGYASTERIEGLLCYIMIPMFFKSAHPTKDAPSMASKDLGYCLQIMYNSILPVNNKQNIQSNIAPSLSVMTSTRINNTGGIAAEISGRQGSVSVTEKGHSATVSSLFVVRESIVQSVFFALKVMILSFQKQMTLHWPKVIKIVKELIGQKYIGNSLLSFTDFLIQANLPISIIVLPMIETKLKQRTNGGTCGSESDLYVYNEIKKKLAMKDKLSLLEKSSRSMLEELNNELITMREEFQTKLFELVTKRETPTKVSGVCEGTSDTSSSIGSIISTMPRNSTTGINIKNSLRDSTRRHSSITGKRGSFIYKNFNKSHDTEIGHCNSQVDAIYEDNEDETPLMASTQRSRQSSIGALGIWRSIRHKKKLDTDNSEYLSGLEDNSIEMMEMQKRMTGVPFSRKTGSLKAKVVSTGVINKGKTMNDDFEKGYINGSPSNSNSLSNSYKLENDKEGNIEFKNSIHDKCKVVQFSSNKPTNYDIEDDDDSYTSITITHHLI